MENKSQRSDRHAVGDSRWWIRDCGGLLGEGVSLEVTFEEGQPAYSGEKATVQVEYEV